MIIEENKKLCERYPYLLPRNVCTDELDKDYDYSYTLVACIPRGWTKLFLQMCEDIRQPLIDADYLDKFRFSQIKEKYGSLRCYTFGHPKTVDKILMKYEHISQYVCNVCGKPAEYVTSGYILPWCNDCWKDHVRHEAGKFVKWNPILTLERFSKDSGTTKEEIDCSEEWNRLFDLKETEANEKMDSL